MPKRTRSHALEDESIREFQQILSDKNWIYEQQDLDYGVDGRVEVFLGEHTTGLSCLAQLKGTDESDDAKALKVRLRTDTIEYLSSLESLVLIVRYLSNGKRIYAKWLHRFSEISEISDQDTVTLNFSEEDLWSEETFNEIQSSLEAERWLRIAPPHSPISISIIDEHSGEHISRAVKEHLASFISDSGQRISVARSTRTATFFYVRIRQADFTVRFGSRRIIRISRGEDDSVTANHIILAIGMVAASVKWGRIGLELIFSVIRSQNIKWDEVFVMVLYETIFANHAFDEALELTETLLNESRPENAIALASALSLSIYSMKQPQVDRLGRIIQKNVSRLPENATHLFNASTFFRVIGRPDIAHPLLKKAAEVDGGYSEEFGWLIENGRQLEMLGHFPESAESYRKALEIRQLSGLVFLYTDSLTSNGDYKLAHSILSGITPDDTYGEDGKILKFVLENIIDLGLDSQTRNPEGGYDYMISHRNDDIDGHNQSIALECIKSFDALSPLAWRVLGEVEVNDPETYLHYLICHLISAYLSPASTDWAEVVHLTSQIIEYEDMNSILLWSISYAYHNFRDEFVSDYMHLIEEEDHSNAKIQYVLGVIDVVSANYHQLKANNSLFRHNRGYISNSVSSPSLISGIGKYSS